jgi:hypothetical protein
MDRQVAETVNAMINAILAKMSEFVAYSDLNSGEENIRRQRKHAIGSCIATLDLEILEPIYREFPDLKPEYLNQVARMSEATPGVLVHGAEPRISRYSSRLRLLFPWCTCAKRLGGGSLDADGLAVRNGNTTPLRSKARVRRSAPVWRPD